MYLLRDTLEVEEGGCEWLPRKTLAGRFGLASVIVVSPWLRGKGVQVFWNCAQAAHDYVENVHFSFCNSHNGWSFPPSQFYVHSGNSVHAWFDPIWLFPETLCPPNHKAYCWDVPLMIGSWGISLQYIHPKTDQVVPCFKGPSVA